MQSLTATRTPLGFFYYLYALCNNDMFDGYILYAHGDEDPLFNIRMTKKGRKVLWKDVEEAFESQPFSDPYKTSMKQAMADCKRDNKLCSVEKAMVLLLDSHAIIDARWSLLHDSTDMSHMFEYESNVYAGEAPFPFPKLSLLDELLRHLKQTDKTMAVCTLVFMDKETDLDSVLKRKDLDRLYRIVPLHKLTRDKKSVADLTYGDVRKSFLEAFSDCMECRDVSSEYLCDEGRCAYCGDPDRIGFAAIKRLETLN
jgi:hypothetical protein